jgi:hypothetical protein
MPRPKKTIKHNPLDDIPRQTINPAAVTEELNQSDEEKLHRVFTDSPLDETVRQIVSYQLDGEDQRGNADLLFNGTHYGFELPQAGFISIPSKELKIQLKRPFPMPQALGGLITGGPLGFLFSFLMGEPKPKKYFFSLKSNQGGVIFISLDRLAVDSIMQVS